MSEGEENRSRCPSVLLETHIGRGLITSRVGLSNWLCDVPYSEFVRLVAVAYEEGIRYFETSHVMPNAEVNLGRAIKELKLPRDDLLICTKILSQYDVRRTYSRKSLVQEVLQSTRALQLDYLDIVYVGKLSEYSNIEDIVLVMNWCIEQGWFFYWGCINWSSCEVLTACWIADKRGATPPFSVQIPYNLFQREALEKEFKHIREYHGVPIGTYSPLCGGILSGKYVKESGSGAQQAPNSLRLRGRAKRIWALYLAHEVRGHGPEDQQKAIAALTELAKELQVSLAILSLAWVLANNQAKLVTIQVSSEYQLREVILAVKFYEISFCTELENRINDLLRCSCSGYYNFIPRPINKPHANDEQVCRTSGRVFYFGTIDELDGMKGNHSFSSDDQGKECGSGHMADMWV